MGIITFYFNLKWTQFPLAIDKINDLKRNQLVCENKNQIIISLPEMVAQSSFEMSHAVSTFMPLSIFSERGYSNAFFWMHWTSVRLG